MIGRALGHYEVVGLLGSGGMGEVYRARDTKLDRDVAIKVLPDDLAADPGRLARFEREAKLLAALNHTNIGAIHGLEESDGVRFLVLELIQGETLAQRLQAGAVPVPEALEIARQIAAALEAAHDDGIIHRDVKPANVLVTPRGGIKVLDFGIAKSTVPGGGLEATAQATGLTVDGALMGTPPYMSPERIRGQEADKRADIWAFGCVLYEMLVGKPAFDRETVADTLAAILEREPDWEALPEDTPASIRRLLQRCLRKPPAERLQHIGDARIVLNETIAGSRQAAGDPTPAAVKPRPSIMRRLVARGLPAALLMALLAVAALFLLSRADDPPPSPPTEPAYARTALAVLPFRNLSADAANAYFAGGLHDELLTKLSSVAALSLRGRTSVMGYAETTKPIRQIAEELGVGTLLDGSVQVVGERLRVSVQLVDAATDEQLWAESYDRTLDDVFAIQSDVAQQVVAAVGAALGSGERQAMTELPTANAEAYRLYLQGLDYYRRPGNERQDLEIAQQLYEQSLELDPEFALAHAALSAVHGGMHWQRYDPSPERVVAQREAAEAALRLAPELPQAHLAMGLWHYWGRRDWAAALAEYAIALRGLPNNAELVAYIGYVHRRLGNWDEVYAAFERATELDPRAADLFQDLGGNSYRVTRRYADAIRAYDRALTLAPDLQGIAVIKGWVYVSWQGQLDTLRAALDRIPRDAMLDNRARAELLLWERDAVSLLEHLESIRPDVLEGQNYFRPKSLYAAWAHQLRGDEAAARLAFAAAREHLDAVHDDLQDDSRVRAARGLALAGLGRREEAQGEARWLEQSVIYRGDAYSGLRLARDRALILAQAGEAEAALDEIERLLAGPSVLSVHTLRLDPRWDSIRDHPRFHALLAAHAE
jgi:serine/threonine-protein kinase